MNDDRLTIDYANMTAEVIGPEHGIASAELRATGEEASAAVAAVRAAAGEGKLGFARLPFDTGACREVAIIADRLAEEVDTFVVLGIGGSALGNTALHMALNHLFHNMLPRDRRGGRPRVLVVDNSDPELVGACMDLLDMERTAVNVVTKSGTTAETMAQCLLFLAEMGKRLGREKMKRRVIATTDPHKGALRDLAQREGYATLAIPPDVGGRFSVLSPVGLLSAAVSGIDIDALLGGARAMHGPCIEDGFDRNPALALALLQHLSCTRKGKTIAVMMPYGNALLGVADWFRQLWAESLGKRVDRAGRVVHAGQTPVKALGATDQHSQIQLYMEGPADKVITFLSVAACRRDIVIPKSPVESEAFGYLAGRTLGELIRSERRATALALARNARPNMTIELPRLSPHTMGMLLYLFEMQTALAGELYGIDAFDQPGVEEGKRLTYAMMGRRGYEELRARIEAEERRAGGAFTIAVPSCY